MSFGTCSWLMLVFARDILSRPPQLLATCTAIFGNVLKIDSTKKVSKMLQGTAAGARCLSLYLQSQRGWKTFAPWPQQSLRGLPDNVVAMLCSLHYIIVLHSGTRKPSRIPHSCCTQTGIAALSLGHPSVHSCFQSGITCK